MASAAVRRRVGSPGKEEALDQIFEPFFTTKSIGIGLGLAIGRPSVQKLLSSLTIISTMSGTPSMSSSVPR